jgi:thiamine biosynthesis lipoprotein
MHRRFFPGNAQAIGLGLTLIAAGCATPPRAELRRYEFEEPQMGVPFRLVLYAENPAKANAGARAAFQRVAALNRILSDYEADSELTRLSRTAGSGRAVPLSADLWRVLARAQEISRLSDGAFDVTVGPYVALWRRARRQEELPDPARLAEARKAVGFENLELLPRTRSARLLVPKMRLDLGGIGKGYAVEEALKVLRGRRIARALVTAGGDMMAGEPPPGKRGWRIEVAPLDVTNAPPACFVLLRRAAISTSGDLFQRVEIGGKRYSHIVDPRTGFGLTDHSLVTVIAPDGMTADALAKAIGVPGPTAVRRLLARLPRVAARIVRQPADRLEVYESPWFRSYLER